MLCVEIAAELADSGQNAKDTGFFGKTLYHSPNIPYISIRKPPSIRDESFGLILFEGYFDFHLPLFLLISVADLSCTDEQFWAHPYRFGLSGGGGGVSKGHALFSEVGSTSDGRCHRSAPPAGCNNRQPSVTIPGH